MWESGSQVSQPKLAAHPGSIGAALEDGRELQMGGGGEDQEESLVSNKSKSLWLLGTPGECENVKTTGLAFRLALVKGEYAE